MEKYAKWSAVCTTGGSDRVSKRGLVSLPSMVPSISMITLSQYRSLFRLSKISSMYKVTNYLVTIYNSTRSPSSVRNTRRREYIVPLVRRSNG
jgi:hypothetical protein